MSKYTTNDKLNAQTEPTGDRVFSQMVTRTTYLIDKRKALEKLCSELIEDTSDEEFIDNLDLSGENTSSSEEMP